VPTQVAVRHAVFAVLGALAVLATAVVPAEARTLARGAKGAEVRAMQKLLRQAGFATKIDGVFGSGTERTVRRLERELGLRVDGRLTRSELRRVRLALRPSDGTGGFSVENASRSRSVAAQTPTAAGAKAVLTPEGLAIPPANAPEEVKQVIEAANEIARTPYRYGGGHGRWDDTGYDCSGSVSYALHGGGLLKSAMPSGSFTSWGEAGEGEWITIYANGGHMYMVVAGLRFDTSGRAKSGSRWQKDDRSASGFVVRHPEGF
jgi:peptidoglycan hydrolase-like protein with peptidoglycan-binding domain